MTARHGRLVGLLGAISDLMDATGEMLPGPTIEVVPRPAVGRALEDFFIARRALRSLHLLMTDTILGGESDSTEDAALLLRRLIELSADIQWMLNGDADHQALRAELSDLHEVARKLRVIVAGTNPEASLIAEARLVEAEERRSELQRSLEAAGTPPTPRDRVAQILRSIDPDLAFFWAHESDAAHSGSIGRSLQRDDEFPAGADAPEWRRRMVLEMALAAAAEMFPHALRIIGLPQEEVARFAATCERIAEAGLGTP